MNKKGFSLVELLGTITIMGILMGLAITAYSRYINGTRKKAYETLVQSSISAMEEYIVDHPTATTVTINDLYEKDYLERPTDPSSSENIFKNGISLGREPLFVLCHDISFIHDRIIVKIVGDLQYFETARLYFINCEIKQLPVVRLELDRAVLLQNLSEPAQKFLAGKPSLGVPVLRPRIGEIQVDPVHFFLAKIFTDQLSISPDEQQVLRLGLVQLVERPDQDTGILLYSDIINICIFNRQLIDKLAFSRSYLQMNRMIVTESLSPFSSA